MQKKNSWEILSLKKVNVFYRHNCIPKNVKHFCLVKCVIPSVSPAMSHRLLLLNREIQVLRHETGYTFCQEAGSGTTRERMFSLQHPVFVRSEEERWVMARSKEKLG